MRSKTFVLACLLASGCGTLLNVSPVATSDPEGVPHRFLYGGVQHDTERIKASIDDVKLYPDSQKALLTNIGTASFHAIDTPLSAVGDTLTLPATIKASIDRGIADYYFPNQDSDPPTATPESPGIDGLPE